jgi:hypothetical protein
MAQHLAMEVFGCRRLRKSSLILVLGSRKRYNKWLEHHKAQGGESNRVTGSNQQLKRVHCSKEYYAFELYIAHCSIMKRIMPRLSMTPFPSRSTAAVIVVVERKSQVNMYIFNRNKISNTDWRTSNNQTLLKCTSNILYKKRKNWIKKKRATH